MAQFSFPDGFQTQILACALAHPEEFTPYVDLLDPTYFQGSLATLTARVALKHQREYSKFPAKHTLTLLVTDELRRTGVDTQTGMDFVDELWSADTGDYDYVIERLVDFAKQRATMNAVREVIKMMQDGKEPGSEIVTMFEKAVATGANINDMGILLHRDYGDVIDTLNNRDYGIGTGYPLLDGVWKRGWLPGWLIVLLAPPKRYKCSSPSTLVLMYDGSTRMVKDVRVGDLMMGDDGSPRTVLSCGSGVGPMYKVWQSNGDTYTVTDDHTLCLKRIGHTVPKGTRFKDRYNTDQILEITAKEYVDKPAWFKRTWKGYKVGVEFPAQEVPIEPYLLGIWLGDGQTRSQAICVGDEDPEILAYLRQYAQRNRMRVSIHRGLNEDGTPRACVNLNLCREKGERNKVTSVLRHLDLIMPAKAAAKTDSRKHIPACYKVNSREIRLQLLAGLIDSDGNFTRNRGFIFVNVNKTLADDTCWLARSLGFKSYVRKVKTEIKKLGYKGYAYRAYIQGRISEIPTKVARKKGINSAKATDRTTIKVERVEDSAWYGVELDGNHRYLLGDFTVTHNSLFCVNLALNMAGPVICADVLYYACEISQVLTVRRMLQRVTGCNEDYMYGNVEKFRLQADEMVTNLIGGKLLVKGYPSKTATIATIKAHAKHAIKQFRMKPRAIVIDYAETVAPSDTTLSEHQQQANIYVEARAMGAELGCCVIMPDRCTKETVGQAVPSMKSFQGAFQKAGVVDAAIGLCSTDAEYDANVLRQFVFLNRHGKAYQHFSGKVDGDVMNLSIDEEIEYDPEEEGEEQFGKRRGKRDAASKGALRRLEKPDPRDDVPPQDLIA